MIETNSDGGQNTSRQERYEQQCEDGLTVATCSTKLYSVPVLLFRMQIRSWGLLCSSGLRRSKASTRKQSLPDKVLGAATN